jgi:hypothetical protein
LQIHPTVESRGQSVRVHHISFRIDRDEHVFAVDSHNRGVLLVPYHDVGYPDFVPEEFLPQQICPLRRQSLVHQSNVPVQVLHQHVRFELQLIRRFNMSQVYLHVNRQSFGTRRFGQLVVATAVCQLRDELLLREGVHVRLQKGTRVVRRGRLSRRGLGHVVGVRQNRSGFGGGSTGQGLRLLQGFRRWRD